MSLACLASIVGCADKYREDARILDQKLQHVERERELRLDRLDRSYRHAHIDMLIGADVQAGDENDRLVEVDSAVSDQLMFEWQELTTSRRMVELLASATVTRNADDHDDARIARVRREYAKARQEVVTELAQLREARTKLQLLSQEDASRRAFVNFIREFNGNHNSDTE